MNIKATIDGVEQEFEWLGNRAGGTHWVNYETGFIYQTEARPAPQDVALRLIRPRHTFGGVVFEETGERQIKLNDWYLDAEGYPHLATTWVDSYSASYLGPRTILRHVCEEA